MSYAKVHFHVALHHPQLPLTLAQIPTRCYFSLNQWLISCTAVFVQHWRKKGVSPAHCLVATVVVTANRPGCKKFPFKVFLVKLFTTFQLNLFSKISCYERNKETNHNLLSRGWKTQFGECMMCENTLTIEGTGSNERGIGPIGRERIKLWISIPLFSVESTSLYLPG